MKENKGIAEKTIVVILAAGRGVRMGRPDVAKVCFEIDNTAAINKIITTFKRKGFSRFLLVVGAQAEQVLTTVSKEHSGIMYVHQHPQLGTGHAAKIAAKALKAIDYSGNILVTLGDKFIEEVAVETLVKGFVKQQADLAILTIPKSKYTDGSGRAFLDKDGQIVDIIEKAELDKQAIIDELKEKTAKNKSITSTQLLSVINKHIPNTKKQLIATTELLKLAGANGTVEKAKLQKILQSKEYNLEINGKKYSAKQIEKLCGGVNPSLYLFNCHTFYKGVEMIDNNNAQGEYYLTDIVKHLASGNDGEFRVRAVKSDNSNWIQGFNSPDELLSIQDYVRRQKIRKDEIRVIDDRPELKTNQYRTVKQWLNKIQQHVPALQKWGQRIYGQHKELYEVKGKELSKVLNCYGKRFGFDEKVCIVRVPGRINLMGRHIDRQGGFNNFLALDRETIAVAGVRKDNNVIAVNTRPKQFKPVRFNISEMIGHFAWSDWDNFINSDWVRDMLANTAGDWGNYIKAAMLRLQHRYQDVKIHGVNLAVSGNIPIAAGLSSSSTILVATLQAAIALNNFALTSQQCIDLCGEGQWFVGSRRGPGDHAAIFLGQRGKIAHVGFLPFRVEDIIDSPKDYQIIIANSHIKAPTNKSAIQTFNTKIASYNLSFALLKQCHREIANIAEYIRDISPTKLSCTTSDIYRMLLKVPQFATRKKLKSMLSTEHKGLMESCFATHTEPEQYHLRAVLLFGIAEIARSKICIDYLQQHKMTEFGNLMKASHDGDRLYHFGQDGRYNSIHDSCTDEYLNKLIWDLASEDPQKVLNAQLYMQPGRYGCSTKEIDQMVDIACSVDGVAGAQMAGPGLGGCIMILAKKDSVEQVRKAMNKNYYKPNKLPSAVIDCITAEGAGLVEF